MVYIYRDNAELGLITSFYDLLCVLTALCVYFYPKRSKIGFGFSLAIIFA